MGFPLGQATQNVEGLIDIVAITNAGDYIDLGGMVAVIGDCDSDDGTAGELMRTLSGGGDQAGPLD